ncbi:3-hydroxybutyrate oligomer hydrolase family protein [Orbaceae bacterium ac157xtp]
MIKKILPSIIVTLIFCNFSYANNSVSLFKKTQDIKLNTKPNWLIINNKHFYDADEDDLVTAGLGFTQLSRSLTNIEFSDINHLSLHDLRKTKLTRYIDQNIGEGQFFGFNKHLLTPLFDGKIAGFEYQAVIDDGEEKVGLLLQVPLDFDKNNPCIVAIPTTDFESIYNAKDSQIRGLWGLKNNCAVVYNDKGLGNYLYSIDDKQSFQIDGKSGAHLNYNSFFSPKVDPKWSAKNKNRFALKQLHSATNSEKKWGEYVLKSIDFAFYQLNDMFSPTNEVIIDSNNTYVLVYGANEGGGAALKAGEYDDQGIIDGIVAVNPQIHVMPQSDAPLYIQYGDNEEQPLQPKAITDYTSYGALYIPCAVSSLKTKNSETYHPFADFFYFAENRCQALKDNNLLTGETTKEQSEEALNKLYEYGWNKEMLNQLPYFYYQQSINLPYRYISQYGKYKVEEDLCDYSVASINQDVLFNKGTIAPLTQLKFQQLWWEGDGTLPIKFKEDINVIDLVNNKDPESPRREFFSKSPQSEVVDYNLAGAMCLHNKAKDFRVLKGLQEVSATGNLNQTKTIIVHGQLNVKNLPDYTARAYVALNSYVEGSFSNLKYIEVENASYFDGRYPFDNTLIPIDYYGESAMNMLWSNLTKEASLPDSQIVRATPRGGKVGLAPAITKDNLSVIQQSAKQKNKIKANDGILHLPNNLKESN